MNNGLMEFIKRASGIDDIIRGNVHGEGGDK